AAGEAVLAAKLGGLSAARVVFWLKLWDAIAFGAVAFVADRLLRSDPARRLRAHLLWTINPLLLWDIIAAGHLDVLAAAVGLLGLLALGKQPDGARPGLIRVLAAGALIGIAADMKINYALFGLGLAWALRRSPARLARGGRGGARGGLPGLPRVGAARRRGPGRPPQPDQRGHLLPVPQLRSPLAVARHAGRGRPGRGRGGAGAAAHARGGRGPARDRAGPGAVGRLAVLLALPVPLVRRDDHLPAPVLPGLPARLAGAGQARGGHHPHDPGEP